MIARKICLLFLIASVWSANLMAQCGTTNIALNKTVVSSSNGAGTVAASAVDGVISTTWQPAYTANDYLQVDLGTPKTVCKVNVKWGRYNAASAFKVQMTNTPATESSWATIATVTSNSPTIGNDNAPNYYDQYVYNDLTISAGSNTGRYIRLLMENLASPNYFVSDFSVFESGTTNNPPTAILTQPAANTTITVGTSVSFSATASDDGSVSKVEFINTNDNAVLAQSLTSPYNATWTPNTAGTYIVKAKATDNTNLTGLSTQQVTITVNPAASSAETWNLTGNAMPAGNSTTPNKFLGTTNLEALVVKTNNFERMRVSGDGILLVGLNSLPSTSPANTLLAVKGYIVSQGVKVTQTNWPDYVFEKDYNLMPLPQLAEFIQRNKHLPGVPSVAQVTADGVNLGLNQEILLRKVEELTLYMIEQNRAIEKVKAENEKLKKEINKLKKKVK